MPGPSHGGGLGDEEEPSFEFFLNNVYQGPSTWEWERLLKTDPGMETLPPSSLKPCLTPVVCSLEKEGATLASGKHGIN